MKTTYNLYIISSLKMPLLSVYYTYSGLPLAVKLNFEIGFSKFDPRIIALRKMKDCLPVTSIDRSRCDDPTMQSVVMLLLDPKKELSLWIHNFNPTEFQYDFIITEIIWIIILKKYMYFLSWFSSPRCEYVLSFPFNGSNASRGITGIGRSPGSIIDFFEEAKICLIY